MSVNAATLLVLKAFYLGRAISDKKQSIALALPMIDAAVDALGKNQDPQSRMRLAFYLLLKAEILRESSQVIELRARAQAVAPNIFENFMAIEDATQSSAARYGMHEGVIADEGVKIRRQAHWYLVGKSIAEVGDFAMMALGVDERNISDKEMNFLHKVTLLDLLMHHGIPYAP